MASSRHSLDLSFEIVSPAQTGASCMNDL